MEVHPTWLLQLMAELQLSQQQHTGDNIQLAYLDHQNTVFEEQLQLPRRKTFMRD